VAGKLLLSTPVEFTLSATKGHSLVRSVILLCISEAHEQIRNYKNSEDYAGYSIGRHEGDVYSS
jgi:hypothetical protein